MKFLAYLFAFVLLISSVSAMCMNQDNAPFCSKDDPTCAVENEADNDNDGWSNSCDAFPENELFWVDYDGDNIGYGSLVYDCNDIDANVLTYCGDVSLLNDGNQDDSNDESDDNSTNEDNNEDSNNNDDSSEDQSDTEDDSNNNDSQNNSTQTNSTTTSSSDSGASLINEPLDVQVFLEGLLLFLFPLLLY
jgi:hypothetical protein